MRYPKSRAAVISIAFAIIVLSIATTCTPSMENSLDPIPTSCVEVVTSMPIIIPKASLLFVLIERTRAFQAAGYTSLSIDILSETLPYVISPGDRLVVAWIEPSLSLDLNQIVVIDEVFEGIVPPQQPTAFPTQTPTPVSPTPFSESAGTAAAQTATPLAATVSANVNALRCTTWAQYATYQATASAYERARQAVIEAFTQRVKEALHSATTDQEQPEARATPVFEALSLAGEFISTECISSQYQHCVLIIFSSMEDWRVGRDVNEVGVPVDLSLGEVAVILYSCRYKDGACAELINDWERHFSAFGEVNPEWILASGALNEGSERDKVVSKLASALNHLLGRD